MAFAVSYATPTVFLPMMAADKLRRRRISGMAAAEAPSPLKPPTPPRDFTAPEPKILRVRSDKKMDFFTASLALFFRLGSGLLCEGYSSAYVSDDEIPPGQYALKVGGTGTIPTMLSLGLLTGSSYTPSMFPPVPLELWAYEGSPFCILVKEVLAELELPHLVHRLLSHSATMKPHVPYLEDPNTGVKMFESAEIIDYLRTTYMLS
ncbi:hypothetical protein QJS04_geneDACA008509 [Acorus gramineus]|uniref:GST N-terminal domain-containing protein n=1 Tax=Acorus gramineus TaxID=55184 RepID=A0AAV9AHP0_ACOGR|nr:hypothetical protein QJS04_geneDACA008509 [Acorus gramineus]